jgi:hypothetical protein
MKKYFTTLIITATMFDISLIGCTKDVSTTNSTYKADSGNESGIAKKPVTLPDSVIVKK